jgi:ATP-dependent DNA helicase RecG
LQATFEDLAHGELEAFHLSLVHGRLNAEEKDAALGEFAAGKTQVLVATSIVEVGIDVPNATLMTVLGANRFGLAQLHQMRGRVCRGKFPGFCCLFADDPSDEARERLTAFISTTDGFKLAEIDFQQRGPGELLGTRQHGLPAFHMADLVRDAAVVNEAREDARRLIQADPGMSQAEHEGLRRLVLSRYGTALDLGDVG